MKKSDDVKIIQISVVSTPAIYHGREYHEVNIYGLGDDGEVYLRVASSSELYWRKE